MSNSSVIPWSVACQAPLSMGVSRQEYRHFTIWATRESQEYWSECHFLLQAIFPTKELNPYLLLGRQDSLLLSHLGSLWQWIWRPLSQSLEDWVGFSYGDGEGLSELREQPDQRCGGKKLHDMLKNADEGQPWSWAHWSLAHLWYPVHGCCMEMRWGRGAGIEWQMRLRNLAGTIMYAMIISCTLFYEHWFLSRGTVSWYLFEEDSWLRSPVDWGLDLISSLHKLGVEDVMAPEPSLSGLHFPGYTMGLDHSLQGSLQPWLLGMWTWLWQLSGD